MAALLAGTLPGLSGRFSENLRARPGLALLFGFIAFVCIPVAAIILMVTIVGLPLALLALLLYSSLPLVGYVTAAVALGEVAIRQFKAEAAARAGWRIGAAVLAVLALALLERIPYLGGLATLAVRAS